jgi:predicted transcriptional regulator YdeE
MPQPVLYGVYTDYESDQDGAYTLVVGMESSEAAELPGALLAARIHPGRYMVFQRNGSMPDVAFRTWQEVWNYFDENDDYERAYTTDFEQYVDENGITIYIAIKD